MIDRFIFPDRVPAASKWKILYGRCLDVMRRMPDNSVDLILTSPPFFKKMVYPDGGIYGQESSVREYIRNQVEVVKELLRILKSTGYGEWRVTVAEMLTQ